MRSALVCALVVVSCQSGCTQIPKTLPYAPYMGGHTCRAFAKTAVDRSTEEYLAGIAVTIAGATGLGVGSAMGPDTSPDAAWYERGSHLFIMVPSAVVTAIGIGLLARAQKTEALADQAATVLVEGKGEADRFLYLQCVSARGDWSGNRSEVSRIQINMFKESLAAAMAVQEAATNAQAQAQSAASLAIDAKGSSVKAAQAASVSADATRNLATATENVIEAMPQKDANPALRDAQATLAGVKKSVAPKPEGSSAPPPPLPALQQQH